MPEAGAEATANPVQFSAYYPREVVPDVWTPLRAYVYIPDAAAAVAAVPTPFVYQVFHATTTPRQTNQIPALFSADIQSVPSNEGVNGLNFASAGDPRVPTLSTGVSRNDGVTPMVRYTKYASQGDPVIQASGIEARLIEAEAALLGEPRVVQEVGCVEGFLYRREVAKSHAELHRRSVRHVVVPRSVAARDVPPSKGVYRETEDQMKAGTAASPSAAPTGCPSTVHASTPRAPEARSDNVWNSLRSVGSIR